MSLRRPNAWKSFLRRARATCGRRDTGVGIAAATCGSRAIGYASGTVTIGLPIAGRSVTSVGISKPVIGTGTKRSLPLLHDLPSESFITAAPTSAVLVAAVFLGGHR